MSLPLPLVSPENAFFWTAGESGRLVLKRCCGCQRMLHPSLAMCPRCRSSSTELHSLSGRGRVYSFTVTQQQWRPDLDVPYVVVLVALDEAPEVRLLSNLVDCDHDNVRIGMAVEVVFANREDVWLPLFRPLTEATAV